MNYYYDIVLNYQDNYTYFYEWDKSDEFDYVKKIMIKTVDSKTLEDIIKFKIEVDSDFLNSICNKTKLKNNRFVKYSVIFCDTKNALAVLFDDDGKSLCKSSFLLDDENSICEISYSINKTNINYNIIKKDKINSDSLQIEKIKKVILLEINKSYEEKNYSKLKFIFLSWFGYLEEDIDKIIEKSCLQLTNGIGDKEYKIYDLIKLSYNNV